MILVHDCKFAAGSPEASLGFFTLLCKLDLNYLFQAFARPH